MQDMEQDKIERGSSDEEETQDRTARTQAGVRCTARGLYSGQRPARPSLRGPCSVRRDHFRPVAGRRGLEEPFDGPCGVAGRVPSSRARSALFGSAERGSISASGPFELSWVVVKVRVLMICLPARGR